jgi:hypothetical protein
MAAAKRAGFGNFETARQAKKVVDNGTPALVEAAHDSTRLDLASPGAPGPPEP